MSITPATATQAAPIPQPMAYIRSVRMPMRLAASRSCEVAWSAMPVSVRLMNVYSTPNASMHTPLATSWGTPMKMPARSRRPETMGSGMDW